jgi:hypothetical protein
MSLPADAAKEGNVWCEACQQSLAPSRAAAHLVSKKHLDKSSKTTDSVPKASAPTAASPVSAPETGGGLSPTEAKTAKPKRAKSADSGTALPRDPNDDTKFWCGLCQVSLGAAQAAKHLTTKSHTTNAANHLTTAMKGAKIK